VAVLLVATWGGMAHGWGSPLILALIGGCLLTLAGYVVAERRAAEPLTPLHLFRSPVFSVSAVQFLMSTMVLFVAMLYVPAFLQAVQHKSAFTAGLYVIPLLVGLIAATAVLAGQNAAAYRHLGTATGALNFFKSLGGAFGAALFGAILVHALSAGSTVAYQSVFRWTVPFMVLALVLALATPEKPLSEEMIAVAEGKVEVPEY